MALGLEEAKGAAEKVFGVKLPILMRMVLPGLLATAVFYRPIGWMLAKFPPDPEHLWERVAAYVVLVFLLGALISTASSEIYKIYEGRILWPDWLWDWWRRRQQARVVRLQRAAKEAPTTARYNEIWYRLRDYPIDDAGDYSATHPTMVGNILAAYEDYPNKRYGIDSVFYWPRIWMQIEKERKEEIDSQWCVADGFLTLSAISYGGAAIWMAQALVALFGFGRPFLPFAHAGWALAAVPAWVALGYFWYRFSIPYHRANGELFKSIFDVYREKVWNLTSLKPKEHESWMTGWAYLQYLAIKCPNCGKYTSFQKEECQKCGFGLMEFKRSLAESGQIVRK